MLNVRTNRGFSLLEVLIALVVFSIGLFGTVALQAVSKKTTYDAVQRTTAATLAADLLERMRANPSVLDDYLGVVTNPILPLPATDCEVTECSPAEVATYDLYAFGRLLAGALETSAEGATGGLVDPTLCVTGPVDGSSGFYEVAIAWRGRSDFPNGLANLCGIGRYGSGDASRRLLILMTFLDAS